MAVLVTLGLLITLLVVMVIPSIAAEADKTLMVGDRHHDIEGAAAEGIDSLGVLYGYGNREELEKAGADYIAETPADIILA